MMKATISTTHLEVDNAIDFLATVLRKERASKYHHSDYLLVKRKNDRSNHISYNDEETVSSFRLDRDFQKIGQWEISAEGRTQVGQWFFKMTSCFGFPSNFAVTAMNYFDRVLSRTNPLPSSKAEIQLLALSCFYLSVKLFQAGPILSIEQICMISGFVFVPSQIVDTEQKILRELEWCLYPPTTLDFLQPYLQIFCYCTNLPLQYYTTEILESAQDFVNEMTLDYYFVANNVLPSHIAIAALVNSICTILPISKMTQTIQDMIRVLAQFIDFAIVEEDVVLCSERLWRLMNANYDLNLDISMNNPYQTPNTIQSNYYRTNSPTPNSPIGVTSYAADISCQSGNIYESMLPITNANYCLTFVRDYAHVR